MVNVGTPEIAFRTSMQPQAGVGLARMEFIINEHIGVHPMALLKPETIASAKARNAIARLVRDYSSPADFFIQRLAEGVGTIAAAFYPKPVIVRLSDFKTNEYASLLGGEAFEPKEENPMLGFRGACPLQPSRLRRRISRWSVQHCAGCARTWAFPICASWCPSAERRGRRDA